MTSAALDTHELYRRRAGRYDVTSHAYALLGYRLDEYRKRGIEALGLHPGDRVVELGCGTGANFARLEAAIGEAGSIRRRTCLSKRESACGGPRDEASRS